VSVCLRFCLNTPQSCSDLEVEPEPFRFSDGFALFLVRMGDEWENAFLYEKKI